MTLPAPHPLTLSPHGRLLIVKLSAIGDVVHALPVATALRRRFSTLEITWAVERWVAPLLHGHPAIDRVVTLPPLRWGSVGSRWARQFAQAARALRHETYDVSLDMQGLLKSAAVVLCAGARRRVAVSDAHEGAWLVSRRLPAPPERSHVVDFNLQCAVALGATAPTVDFGLIPAPHAVAAVDARLTALGLGERVPFVVLNPSASTQWKVWAPEHWAVVAATLSSRTPVVLVGTAAQRRAHAAIAAAAGSRRVLDLSGATSLAELVALLDRSALHLAGDTGSLHIAAALGRPVVGVYGPTAAWRKGPYGQLERVVERHDLCGGICPRLCRTRRCLTAIAPDTVVAAARRVLDDAARSGGVLTRWWPPQGEREPGGSREASPALSRRRG